MALLSQPVHPETHGSRALSLRHQQQHGHAPVPRAQRRTRVAGSPEQSMGIRPACHVKVLPVKSGQGFRSSRRPSGGVPWHGPVETVASHGSSSVVDLAGDTAKFLDVPLHPRLADSKAKLSDLGEEEEHVTVQLLAILERAPPNFPIPVREPDGAVSIESVCEEGEVADKVEGISPVLEKLSVRLMAHILEVYQRHCEVQRHITVMHLIPVENVSESHANEPRIVPVGEELQDTELGDEFVKVVREQGALVGVRILYEKCVIAHRHRGTGSWPWHARPFVPDNCTRRSSVGHVVPAMLTTVTPVSGATRVLHRPTASSIVRDLLATAWLNAQAVTWL
mmetsp:Transcript_29122/g.76922  ORF Transcript_29122/g.76922 Transcript_29122/m.76922 type:complete len:338 (-) Transcript_29122:155-1168(-)